MPHAQPRPAPHNPLAEDLLAVPRPGIRTASGFSGRARQGAHVPRNFCADARRAGVSRAPAFESALDAGDCQALRLCRSAQRGRQRFAGGQPARDGHSLLSWRARAHRHRGAFVRRIFRHDGEEFLKFLRAVAASGPAVPKPTPLDKFLAAHPAAMRFAVAPKPIPTSFARESFFGVSALQFTNRDGASRFGRYRIRPDAGTEYLTDDEAAKQAARFSAGRTLGADRPRPGQVPPLGAVGRAGGRGERRDEQLAGWPTGGPTRDDHLDRAPTNRTRKCVRSFSIRSHAPMASTLATIRCGTYEPTFIS